MDRIILKSNLVINLLGKREVTLEDIQDIDELLLDGSGINFSATEMDNIKHDLQYIFASIKENAGDITFTNCPDSIREYIIKNAPTEDIYFEGYEEFFDELKENHVSISEQFQKYLGDDSDLTEYEVFQYVKTSQIIDLKPVITVSDLDLIQKYGNISDFQVKVESLEEYEQVISLLGNEPESSIIVDKNIMQQIIDGKANILPTTNISLQVESMTEVTPEQLSYFCDNLNVANVRVSYGPNEIDDFYSIEDFEKLQSEVKDILSQVDQSLPELDRFMKIYEIIGKKIQYEHDENGEPSLRKEAHNMKGGLLENTCVCEGYSKILQQVLKCNGIECKCVSGIGESEGHAWNQVKIDGQWYNCDLTWDAEKLKNNRPLDYCLQSDEEFISHTSTSRDVERCENSYDRNKLHSALDYAVPLEFEEKQYDIDEVMTLLQDFGKYGNNGVRLSVDMDYTTGKHCLTIGNIVSDDEVKWSDNKILIDNLEEFMQSYISSYSTTEITKQGIVDFIRNNAGIELVVDDKLKQQLMEKGIDLESLYTISKVEEQKGDTNQPGYSREENGTLYTEKQQQVLKDANGNEIGNRTITWNTDIQNGTESIETLGALENSDSKYKMKEVSKTVGGELQSHRKEFVKLDKTTGIQEHFAYQKDSKGNETYFKTVNGKLACKIVKTAKGFTIDTFENGQPIDTFEYDKDGTAIFGMPGVESLESDYLENLFNSNFPYFEAENRSLNTQQTQTVDTQKLGKESMEEQRDTDAKDTVESDMEEQMRNNTRSQQPYHEQPETKTHSTENPESFRSKMKFEMTQEQYQEILDRHTAAEENFAREMAENPEKKKTEQAEYGVK